jgi:hypothetical protein
VLCVAVVVILFDEEWLPHDSLWGGGALFRQNVDLNVLFLRFVVQTVSYMSNSTPLVAKQRADEIAKVDPKVAYYARMYALEQVGLTVAPICCDSAALDHLRPFTGSAVVQ